jgi:hypothetical protein
MHITQTRDFDPNGADDGTVLTDVRQMTQSQLRCLGVPSMVYLRAGTADGQTAYGIYAADGTAVAVVDDVELAVELAAEQGLIFVAVH